MIETNKRSAPWQREKMFLLFASCFSSCIFYLLSRGDKCYNNKMKNDKKLPEWPLVGNTHVTNHLDKIITRCRENDYDDSLTGTYIFSGPNDLGKGTIAGFFAKILLCDHKLSGGMPCGTCHSCRQFGGEENAQIDFFSGVHSDFFVVERAPGKKNIAIEQVRQLIRNLQMSSFTSAYKVAIIKDGESLSEEAANSLLKTLEEPRSRVVVMIMADNVDALPETIISRSQMLRFLPVKTEMIYDFLVKKNASRSAAKNISRLALGRPALAMKLFQDQEYLNEYLQKVKLFLKIIGSDMNSRFMLVQEMTNGKETNQEAVDCLEEFLGVWQSVARDFLLISGRQDDLMRHVIMDKEVSRIAKLLAKKRVITILEKIDEARSRLLSNVPARLAMESLVLGLE